MTQIHGNLALLLTTFALGWPLVGVGHATPWVAAPASALLAAPLPAVAQGTVNVGSTGADGAFNPTANVTIDLATQGTYDPQRWMVIFNYTSVNIPQGVTVTFKNHPSRAPVVWLVQQSVVIAGTVIVDGQPGHSATQTPSFAEPGPGGYRGGRGSLLGGMDDSTNGFGWGGGSRPTGSYGGGGGGGFSTAGLEGQGGFGYCSGGSGGSTYGSASLLQLIGGSGGSGPRRLSSNLSAFGGGGGGGGAILIAANSDIIVTGSGTVRANGGNGGSGGYECAVGGGGSGGSIRLFANNVFLQTGTPGANVVALGGVNPLNNSTLGHGGLGRIVIQKNNVGGIDVATTPVAVIPTGGIFNTDPLPVPTTMPSLAVIRVASSLAPSNPLAAFGPPDIQLNSGGAQVVEIEGRNVPLAANIVLRVTSANGFVSSDINITSTPVGNDAYWTRTANVTIPTGYTTLQLRALIP